MNAEWVRRGCGICLAIVGLAISVGPVRGHVDYVTDSSRSGDTGEMFRAVFTDPASVGLLCAGGLGVFLLMAGYLRFASAVPDIDVARRTLRAYKPYLPWMLRLSVGLPLVGAGFAGYLFSPSVTVDIRLLQVGVGFLLLFGLATRLVALIGLGAYLTALATDATLLLASEYVAGFLCIAVVGPGQPSADMLFHRLVITDGTLASRLRNVTTPDDLLGRVGVNELPVALILRLFVGANFVYLGASQKWFNVSQSLAVVAKYDLTSVVPVSPELWVFGAGLVEIAVGVAFITGTFTRGAAGAGFLLLTTTLFGLPDDPVLAHVTLFGLLSALLVTGGGRYSLDAAVVPALHRRLDPELPSKSGGRPSDD